MSAAERAMATPARSLELLARHRERFPAGILSLERDALEVEALCAAGQQSRGEAAARRFLTTHPESALVSSVNKACQLEDR